LSCDGKNGMFTGDFAKMKTLDVVKITFNGKTITPTIFRKNEYFTFSCDEAYIGNAVCVPFKMS
jgi:hypothetical protein